MASVHKSIYLQSVAEFLLVDDRRHMKLQVGGAHDYIHAIGRRVLGHALPGKKIVSEAIFGPKLVTTLTKTSSHL